MTSTAMAGMDGTKPGVAREDNTAANQKSQAGAAADDIAPAIRANDEAAKQPARVWARAGHMQRIEEQEESRS